MIQRKRPHRLARNCCITVPSSSRNSQMARRFRDSHHAHRSWRTLAERHRRELQRQVPRRMPEPRVVPQPRTERFSNSSTRSLLLAGQRRSVIDPMPSCDISGSGRHREWLSDRNNSTQTGQSRIPGAWGQSHCLTILKQPRSVRTSCRTADYNKGSTR